MGDRAAKQANNTATPLSTASFSFVKRFQLWGRSTIEARMELYNVFDNINFNATTVGGSTYRSWEVTSAARELNASQDAGGRITSFGLRYTW